MLVGILQVILYWHIPLFGEAEVAINHILGVEDRMNYDCVPGVVYTNPEVAGVGKTEERTDKIGDFLTVYPNYRWLIPVGL